MTDKPLRGEVIVLLDDDPLKPGLAIRPLLDPRWTCTLSTLDVTSLP